MDNLSFDKPAGALVKTTLVDFPGIVAGSFFLKGCNLRCPYCYNKGLIDNSESEESLTSINQLFDHLKKRQGILHGLVISGGEPLLNPYTPFIIKEAKLLGYKVKLDTNGTLPFELESFITNTELCPDFIAMDLKTSPYKYANLLCNPHSKFFKNEDYFFKSLTHSINIISTLPSNKREFRTVLVPSLINKNEIKELSAMLPEDACWRFAQFRNENCLDPLYNNITPYTEKEINELINLAKMNISDSKLR